MRYWLLALGALLGACATPPPPEIITTGEKKISASKRPPVQVAACIERNVEASSYRWVLSSRPPDSPGERQVIVRSNLVDPTDIRALFIIRPITIGSEITLYTGSGLPMRHQGTWHEEWIKGC
jgi:hypothetical protein